MEIQLPPIVPLYYKGERVLTNRQMAELFKVTESMITHHFSRHKSDFVEGFDFFYPHGKDFSKFKAEALARDLTQEQDGTIENDNLPNVNLTQEQDGKTKKAADYIKGNVIKLWAKSGAFKMSKYIGTDNAKLIYISLAQGYFQPEPAKLPPPKKIKDDGASVYCFEMSNGTVKIGISHNVPDRAKNLEWETHLKVTNIFYLTVETRKKAAAIEETLHKYFESQCVQGEYFLIDFEEACNQIKKIISNIEIEVFEEAEREPKKEKSEVMLEFMKLAQLTTDEKLRDEIIRETARLILNREF